MKNYNLAIKHFFGNKKVANFLREKYPSQESVMNKMKELGFSLGKVEDWDNFNPFDDAPIRYKTGFSGNGIQDAKTGLVLTAHHWDEIVERFGLPQPTGQSLKLEKKFESTYKHFTEENMSSR